MPTIASQARGGPTMAVRSRSQKRASQTLKASHAEAATSAMANLAPTGR